MGRFDDPEIIEAGYGAADASSPVVHDVTGETPRRPTGKSSALWWLDVKEEARAHLHEISNFPSRLRREADFLKRELGVAPTKLPPRPRTPSETPSKGGAQDTSPGGGGSSKRDGRSDKAPAARKIGFGNGESSSD